MKYCNLDQEVRTRVLKIFYLKGKKEKATIFETEENT